MHNIYRTSIDHASSRDVTLHYSLTLIFQQQIDCLNFFEKNNIL